MIFGKKLRELREQNNLVLRKVAAKLSIDTATLSKIERGDRFARKEHLQMLADIYNFPLAELKTLWLADKVFGLVCNEDLAMNALKVAENELNSF